MKTVIFLLAFALAGCAHIPTEYAPSKKTRAVKIETDPPGMRCYYGIAGTVEGAVRQRGYVGISPCVAIIPSDGDNFPNTVSKFARPQAVFMAEPPAGITNNVHPQKQIFAVPGIFNRPPPIPRAIFFNMHVAY